MTQNRQTPGPGQESVWDYPRPPRCESCERQIVVIDGGQKIAESFRTVRVLETSHPPVYYIPRDDVQMDLLTISSGTSWCEWKGKAVYYLLQRKDGLQAVAWSYPQPTPAFVAVQNHLAFYPSRVDQCLVDGETVTAQQGDFYGGWITSEIVGPFKGPPGTWGW